MNDFNQHSKEKYSLTITGLHGAHASVGFPDKLNAHYNINLNSLQFLVTSACLKC